MPVGCVDEGGMERKRRDAIRVGDCLVNRADDPGERIGDDEGDPLAGEPGVPWPHLARHMLGLRHWEPGARRWRQVWSDHRLKADSPATVSRLAMARP